MHPRAWLPALLLLAAASRGCGPTWESLPRPVYAWFLNGGLCYSTLALDDTRTLWRESRCERSATGWQRVAQLTTAQHQRVADAFAAHPSTPTADPLPSECSDGVSRFALVRGTIDDRAWGMCGGSGYQSVTLPEPFATTARAFIDTQP